MLIFFFKTGHIIALISWMAGMFYLGRIFVYHREAMDKGAGEQEVLVRQFRLMEARVYRLIMMPGLILTWFFGLGLIHLYGKDWFVVNTWLHMKLIFVAALTAYHFWAGQKVKRFAIQPMEWSGQAWRMLNELPTVSMFVIVALAVYKNTVNPWVLLLSTSAFVLLLILLTVLYKKIRNKR